MESWSPHWTLFHRLWRRNCFGVQVVRTTRPQSLGSRLSHIFCVCKYRIPVPLSIKCSCDACISSHMIGWHEWLCVGVWSISTYDDVTFICLRMSTAISVVYDTFTNDKQPERKRGRPNSAIKKWKNNFLLLFLANHTIRCSTNAFVPFQQNLCNPTHCTCAQHTATASRSITIDWFSTAMNLRQYFISTVTAIRVRNQFDGKHEEKKIFWLLSDANINGQQIAATCGLSQHHTQHRPMCRQLC